MEILHFSKQILLLIGSAFLSIFFIYNYLSKEQNSSNDTMIVVFIIISMLLLFIINPISYYFRLKKFFNSHKILGKQTITIISGNGIEESVQGLEIKLLWENIYKVKELKNYFLLYQSSTSYGFLPKSALNNNEIEEIKAILKRNHIKTEFLNT